MPVTDPSSFPINTSLHLSGVDLKRSFSIGSRQVEVLRGVSLDVMRGDILFLVGASGAGKSTLLYTLAGLERPDSGSVLLDGEALYSGAESHEARIRNRKVGFVFQGFHLLPELTAEENVALPLMISGNSNRTHALELLDAVGLADRSQHLPLELSGGEQQRVAIARALVNDPEILFADEPTGNLDSKNSELILDLLLSLTQKKQRTLIVVTHDTELSRRGNRRLEIRDGHLT